jgi:hypothetical protein
MDRASSAAGPKFNRRVDDSPEDGQMIQVKCVGGECNGVTVKVEPQPTYYEVVDPRDPLRRDYYILEVGQWGARLVPEASAEWSGRM